MSQPTMSPGNIFFPFLPFFFHFFLLSFIFPTFLISTYIFIYSMLIYKLLYIGLYIYKCPITSKINYLILKLCRVNALSSFKGYPIAIVWRIKGHTEFAEGIIKGTTVHKTKNMDSICLWPRRVL